MRVKLLIEVEAQCCIFSNISESIVIYLNDYLMVARLCIFSFQLSGLCGFKF